MADLCNEDDELVEFLTTTGALVESLTDALTDALVAVRHGTRSEELIDVIRALQEACAIAGGAVDECAPIIDDMLLQLEPEGITPTPGAVTKLGDPDPTLN